MAAGVIRVIDGVRYKLIDFTCDAAYATGGYAFTPSTFGFREIFGVDLVGNHPGVQVSYNPSTQKLQLQGSGTASQSAFSELAANSTVVSASTILRLIVWGI